MSHDRKPLPASAAAPHWRQRLRLYWKLVRADRPIGWLLLLWPTWWGLWIAAGGVPPLWPLMPKPPRAVRNLPVLSAMWLPGGNFAVPVLGNTGSWREQLLATGLTVYALWCVVAGFIG